MLTRTAALLFAFIVVGPPAPPSDEWSSETGEAPIEFDPTPPLPPLWDQPGGFWLSVEMLGGNPTNTVHMPAGQFKAPTLSLSGEKSVDFFVGIYAEKLFLATAGISFDAGLT